MYNAILMNSQSDCQFIQLWKKLYLNILILYENNHQVHVLWLLVDILASSHPHILRFMYYRCLLISSHNHILISLGSCTLVACWYPRILTSLYLQVHVLWVLVNIFASSRRHILRFMYSGCLLVSSHPHIFMSLGSFTPSAC